MQKILIINNAELYNLLTQIKSLSSISNLLHITSLTEEITTSDAIIISSKAQLTNSGQVFKNIHFICLIDSTEQAVSINGTCNTIFLEKPYRLAELVTIINNILASKNKTEDIIKIGDFAFNPSARTLSRKQEEFSLTEKESALIYLLATTSEETVPKEEVLKEVWQYDASVDTHTIETHIYRIRQKVGKENDFIGSSAAGYFIKLLQ